MAFTRLSVAADGGEVGRGLLARTMLGEPLKLCRAGAAEAVARRSALPGRWGAG
ncbi:hypothetical protein [Micromonospora sp. NPDC050276]|uniref:hypothetical protein n=1 Tax=Micromonospora sp. NPDC050276 TaxID=3364278 RepID=UPI0037AF274B